jgi:uncharacterized RDD family membrane protein YckC
LGASAYEALLIAAILIAVGFALLPAVTPPRPPAGAAPAPGSLYVMSPPSRALSAAAAIAATAAYCGWFWSRGRRTLAMKTWRIELAAAGEPLSVSRALARYLACFIGPAVAIAAFVALQPLGQGRWAGALLATNYVWALLDPDRRFLQDRIAGTGLVREAA